MPAKLVLVLSDRVVQSLQHALGNGYVPLAFGLALLVPALLIAAAAKVFGGRPRTGLPGFAWGVAVAVWASACWLCIPYCGVYPNLPGALLGALLFGVDVAGRAGQESTVLVTNFVLWPLLGYTVARYRRPALVTPAAR